MMCDALDVNNLIESEGAVKGNDRCSWAVSSGGIYTVTAKKAKMAIPFDHPAARIWQRSRCRHLNGASRMINRDVIYYR